MFFFARPYRTVFFFLLRNFFESLRGIKWNKLVIQILQKWRIFFPFFFTLNEFNTAIRANVRLKYASVLQRFNSFEAGTFARGVFTLSTGSGVTKGLNSRRVRCGRTLVILHLSRHKVNTGEN